MGSTTDAGGLHPPGTVLSGRYRIVSLIGRGGMGEVYRADDLVLGEPVALKFLPEVAAANPTLMERFLTEVRLARKVTHPNVARVHDIGEADGRTFLSMEYVDGEDLHQLLRRIGRLPAEKALEISKQICEGLHAAHDRGVLHRDLKPANIMLDGDGRVRITDFGLAELAAEGGDGRVMGTPAYMSPEQISGGTVTERSDLYSLGLLLYELFTGKRAFEGKSLAEYQRMQQHETPSRPSTILEQVDPAVEAIILRCIEKDPAARPSSARQVTLGLPGGDPLAVALASGDTPAPELVAAAGGGEAAPVKVVTGWFVAWLVLLGVLLALAPSDPSRDLILEGEKAPAVLKDRIRELLRDVGYPTPPADDAAWHSSNRDLRTARVDGSTVDLPSSLVYHYRQSPKVLGLTGVVFTMTDPAPIVPGMVAVRMGATGRLLELSAVPGGPDDTDAEDTPVPDATWQRLFEIAGLDRKAYETVEPDFLPPVQTSERHAWEAHHDDGTTSRVEAAGQGGLPVTFALSYEFPADESAAENRSNDPNEAPGAGTWIFLGILVMSIGLAWRNVKAGRTDRTGAFRLAQFTFLTHVIYWLGGTDHPGSVDGWFASMFSGLGYSLLLASFVYVMFLALEPTVRKRWPSAMISWTRLVRGRLGDPVVGRDILVGGALALLVVTLTQATDRVFQTIEWDGEAASRMGGGAESVLSGLVNTIHVGGDSVLMALALIFILVLIRAVVPISWLFGVVASLGMATFSSLLTNDSFQLYTFIQSGLLGLLVWWLLTHYGILACLVAMYVVNVIGRDGFVAPLDAWDGHTTVINLLALIALAVWGWRAALAGRPVVSADG